MGIVDTLFRRFKELAAAAEKEQKADKTPSINPTSDHSPETSSQKQTLADSVLEIQKKKPQP